MSSASSAVTYTSVYTDSEPRRVFWGADQELSVVAQRVANAIEAIAIYDTKTNMAPSPLSRPNEKKTMIAENVLATIGSRKTMTTVNQGMSVEEIEQVVAQRVANAIEAIAIYETKTNMARKSLSQTKREEDNVAENAINKRR
ncbi:hypothetical protein Tco_0462464 [Tanacetum coccineum]